jgi:hypothetical protein
VIDVTQRQGPLTLAQCDALALRVVNEIETLGEILPLTLGELEMAAATLDDGLAEGAVV